MASIVSAVSHFSEKSQQLLENVSKKGESTIWKLQGDTNEETLNSVWTAFGAYVARQIRLGKSVNIPKFGLITFGAPEYRLEGVTNPEVRDIRYRKPVFIVSKDFGKGISCKAGIFTGQGIRPYSVTGIIAGLPTTKINYTEIGSYCNLDKDATRLNIERVIKEMSDKVREGSNVEMTIPNVGTLYIRNNIAAVKFDGFLMNDVIDITTKSIKEKKFKEENLTVGNIQKLLEESKTQFSKVLVEERELIIDQGASNYLKSQLDIDVDQFRSKETVYKFTQ